MTSQRTHLVFWWKNLLPGQFCRSPKSTPAPSERLRSAELTGTTTGTYGHPVFQASATSYQVQPPVFKPVQEFRGEGGFQLKLGFSRWPWVQVGHCPVIRRVAKFRTHLHLLPSRTLGIRICAVYVSHGNPGSRPRIRQSQSGGLLLGTRAEFWLRRRIGVQRGWGA